MSMYQTPGVYFEWLNTRQAGIELQRTDITGFVGICQRGPLHQPLKIESWPQFNSIFGGCIPQAYLAYVVQGFFANGGQTCWVVRVADPQVARCAWVNLRDECGTIRLSLRAITEGVWAHQLEALVLRGGFNRFTLTLRLPDGTQELWRDLTLEGDGPLDSINDISNGSRLVRAFRVNADKSSGQTIIAGRYSFHDGQDGLASLLPAHLTGNGAPPDQPWGLALFEDIPEISLLAIPDVMTKAEGSGQIYTPPPRCDVPPWPDEFAAQASQAAAPAAATLAAPAAFAIPVLWPTAIRSKEKANQVYLQEQPIAQAQADAEDLARLEMQRRIEAGLTPLAAPVIPPEYPPAFDDEQISEVQWRMILQCEIQKNRMAVLDLPRPEMMPKEALDWIGLYRFDSSYAELNYPWLRVPDPNGQPGELREIPPCGHVAGVYARVEKVFGVYKPPANELLASAQDVSMPVNDVIHGLLNEAQINAIRVYPGRGLRLAGERTLSSDPLWRYVNVRRLLIMIERSIDVSTQWIPFEPNNFRMWRDTERIITNFLDLIWRRGMLDGASPEEAYTVRCDETTNPPAEIDQGRLLCLVGVQPPWPAEFVIARIGRTESGSLVLEG
jgi:uncharacterized protein